MQTLPAQLKGSKRVRLCADWAVLAALTVAGALEGPRLTLPGRHQLQARAVDDRLYIKLHRHLSLSSMCSIRYYSNECRAAFPHSSISRQTCDIEVTCAPASCPETASAHFLPSWRSKCCIAAGSFKDSSRAFSIACASLRSSAIRRRLECETAEVALLSMGVQSRFVQCHKEPTQSANMHASSSELFVVRMLHASCRACCAR